MRAWAGGDQIGWSEAMFRTPLGTRRNSAKGARASLLSGSACRSRAPSSKSAGGIRRRSHEQKARCRHPQREEHESTKDGHGDAPREADQGEPRIVEDGGNVGSDLSPWRAGVDPCKAFPT